MVEQALFPTILAIAEARAVQMAVEATQSAVRDYLQEHRITYGDLVGIEKDRAGRTVLLHVNAPRVSEIAAGLAIAAERALARLEEREFGIPLGQALGSQLLATYGPRIGVRLIPAGDVKVDLLDRFEEAGINQTRHHIALKLDTRVRIVVPWQKTEVRVATQVPLVDSVILGAVPSTYVSLPGGLFGSGQLRLDTGEGR